MGSHWVHALWCLNYDESEKNVLYYMYTIEIQKGGYRAVYITFFFKIKCCLNFKFSNCIQWLKKNKYFVNTMQSNYFLSTDKTMSLVIYKIFETRLYSTIRKCLIREPSKVTSCMYFRIDIALILFCLKSANFCITRSIIITLDEQRVWNIEHIKYLVDLQYIKL